MEIFILKPSISFFGGTGAWTQGLTLAALGPLALEPHLQLNFNLDLWFEILTFPLAEEILWLQIFTAFVQQSVLVFSVLKILFLNAWFYCECL
jgi:hypothetical protein